MMSLAQSDGSILIIIRDNGIGMEDVEKSMEPAYSTVEDRMGLGFVFMKSFMDEFTVISTPGCGTTLLMRKQPQKMLMNGYHTFSQEQKRCFMAKNGAREMKPPGKR